MAWILDTLIRRQKYYNPDLYRHLQEDEEFAEGIPDVDTILGNDQREIEKIRKLLEQNTFYVQLQSSGDVDRRKEYRKRVINGWFPEQFNKLMENANLRFFEGRYVHRWLSFSAHTYYLIVRQSIYAKTYDQQMQLCRFCKSLAVMILGRLCIEYAKVFPQSQNVLDAELEGAALAQLYVDMSEEYPVVTSIKGNSSSRVKKTIAGVRI